MSRLLAALALVLLAQCALAVRVTNSHSLVRRNTLSFEAEREESEFPLCPSPDSDDEMECPKRNGICCSFEGRPTGRCCAQGETCTSDDPPQCVAYAGMRHLDTLVEKMDTGLHHVDHLDEGELPAILVKKTKKVVVDEDEKPSSSKSSRANGSIRDEKLELLREDLLSLEGKAEQDAKYLTQTEYDDVEKELRTLAPPTGSFQQDSNSTSSDSSSTNTTSETPEEILQREQAEEAERKEKEIEYAKQHENEKDKLEDMIESEVEHDNSKIVDNEIRREHLWPNRKVIRVVHHTAPAPSTSSSSSKKVVVDHVNMVEQRRRVEELKAKIAELEEPLKLQVEPDEAAVHALNYLKARLREMEEEGVHPTDSHKNNAREFLRAIENVKPKSSTTTSDGCNSDGVGDCITTSSATNDAPVEITSQIRSFLPKGALPSNCMVGITC